MNLIEQLGGYERAKQILISCEFHGRKDLRVPVAGGFIHIVVDFLEKDLLDYRKEHNIFEVGDKVFYTGRANDNDLYTLKEIYSGHDFVVGSNGADKDFWTLFISEIRHATTEEIQAGVRV